MLLFAGFGPEIANAVIAMRPKGLEPLNVQQEIYDRFGGRPGQWVILTTDGNAANARERADRIAEALSREAIRAMANFQEDRLASTLLDRYDELSADEKSDARV